MAFVEISDKAIYKAEFRIGMLGPYTAEQLFDDNERMVKYLENLRETRLAHDVATKEEIRQLLLSIKQF